MNWETYQSAYQNATPELRELLDSEKIPVCVKNSLENRKLLALRKVSVVEVSAYIIGIQTIDETVKNLTQAGIPDALQFLAEVQTCIKQPPASPATVPRPIQQNLTSEISATEHDLASLQTVRTMSHDMELAQGHPVMQAPVTETTYTSNQADILRPAPAAPVVTETPRWDTE